MTIILITIKTRHDLFYTEKPAGLGWLLNLHDFNAIANNFSHEGLGKPEPLRHELAGYWSRRITDKDRLIYRFDEDTIFIIGCKGHYD